MLKNENAHMKWNQISTLLLQVAPVITAQPVSNQIFGWNWLWNRWLGGCHWYDKQEYKEEVTEDLPKDITISVASCLKFLKSDTSRDWLIYKLW